MKRCCICGCILDGYGNNPEGAMWKDPTTGEIVEPTFDPEDECCADCNNNYVIPGRLYRISRNKENK